MASHGHLAYGALQTLANLEGVGQNLGIASLLRTKTLEGVENPIIFIAFVIVKGIINYTVSILRTGCFGLLLRLHHNSLLEVISDLE
jgi:hypothetical protein